MKEHLRGVLFELDVADFIDDDQPVAAQPDQFLAQPPARCTAWRLATQSMAIANRTELRVGNPAARVRSSAPEASRAANSRDRTTS